MFKGFAPFLLYSAFGETKPRTFFPFLAFYNKDTKEEEKQGEEVTLSETNQGKTPSIEEKKQQHEPKSRKTPAIEENKLEQVKHEVPVGETKATKKTHIKKTNLDPESKILATDEEKTSTAHTKSQGRETCFYRDSVL